MKYIYYGLLLSGLAILLIRRRVLDRRLLLFIPLLAFIIITELASDVWRIFWPYHVNQTIGCVLLCMYYFLIFREGPYRRLVWLGLLLYLGFCAFYFARSPEAFFKFDPKDMVIESILIVVFSLVYLIDLYLSHEPVHFANFPHFWIVSGNLVFFSGTALFMVFALSLMQRDRQLFIELGYIVKVLNLLLYSVYIKAFLCHLEEKSLS